MTVRQLTRFALCFFLASATVSTLTGCGDKAGDPKGSDKPAPGKAGDPTPPPAVPGVIKVGAYLSLTGTESTFGTTTEEGIKLAVKERNAKGGFKGARIELTIYDNQGKVSETGPVVSRLIDNDEVIAVLGEVASGRSLAAAPICQERGVPMITPSSTNPEVTRKGNMIFRVCFIDPDQGYGGAKFAISDLKAKKAAVLYDQSQPYSTGLAKNFAQWFRKLGGEVTAEQAYKGGDLDFSAQLNNIKATAPDVLYVPGYYNELPNIAIQARKAGITIPLLGGDGWEHAGLNKDAEYKLNGCYFSNHYAPESTKPESIAYVAAFQKEYGKPTSALAALGYDAANLLFDAMERSPSLKGKDLAAALAATKGYKGVTGDITMDKDRNAKKAMVIIKIQGDKEEYVTTIEPPKE